MDQPFSYDKYFRKNFHFLAIFEAPPQEYTLTKSDQARPRSTEPGWNLSPTKSDQNWPSFTKPNQDQPSPKETEEDGLGPTNKELFEGNFAFFNTFLVFTMMFCSQQ